MSDFHKVAEWIPRHSKWDEKDLHAEKALDVFFMNKCPEDWTYATDKIFRSLIMQIANGPSGWCDCFDLGSDQNDSQIRVQFQCKFVCLCVIAVCRCLCYSLPDESEGSWSAIGNAAKYIPVSEPTMVLDFTDMTDKEMKATVIHQFGHALGLGHALMNINDWNLVKDHIDVEKMMESYGLKSRDYFQVQWTGHERQQSIVKDANYDDESVMSYR